MSANKIWTQPKLSDSADLPDLLPYPEIIRRLLVRRGITTQAAAERFLNPDYETGLHDPYLMKDMKPAVERIVKAVKNAEKIMIFGDYDADGVPASAILAEFFSQIGQTNFSVYIPHRHNEPYGLSESAVRKFADQGYRLIITVDCGITAVKETALAATLGIDVIITDHHLAQAELPKATAILNPKQPDCVYPDKMLSGAGVVFKLISALTKHQRINYRHGQEKWLLDLVAIATIADLVPLVDENRVLAHFGLKVLNKTRRLGLLYLFNLLKLTPCQITEDDVSFLIGPRLNSAGRMSHASQAYFLLTTAKEHEAETITRHLEDQNNHRRRVVAQILDYAGQELKAKLEPIVIIGRPDWPIGVLGLAATRLAEKYNRLFFVWGQNGHGEIKGSGRSDGRVNIVDLLVEASKICPFIDFGGHAAAAGFSLAKKNIDRLAPALLEAYKNISKSVISREILVDACLSLDDIEPTFYKEISRLAPFGIGNPKPVFLFKNIIIRSGRSFGPAGNHLELTFQKTNGEIIKAIAFFACFKTGRSGKRAVKNIFGDIDLSPGRTIDLLANVEKANFYSRPELRLRIVDLIVVA